MTMLMYVNEKVMTVSEALRSALSKLLSMIDDIILTCHRIIHILQKDSEHFNEHVTQVTADIRNYVIEQKERVTEDATVKQQHQLHIGLTCQPTICGERYSGSGARGP